MVDVAISMGHSAETVQLLVLGEALIAGAIFKLNNAETLPLLVVMAPMTLILSVLINFLEVVVPVEVLATLGVLQPVLVFLLGHEGLL